MNNLVQILAEKRHYVGTGNARAFRREGKIPGIIYGENKDPILISIEQNKLKLLLQDSGFFSRQCEVKVDDEVFTVLPKDLQIHPVKESIIHVDFLRVGKNTTVTLYVPVKFINENKCEGMKQGGVLNVVRREVELKSPVTKVPEYLEANLEGLEIGDSIHISSIKLDEEVNPTIKDRDFTIATIAAPTVLKTDDESQVDTNEQSESSEGASSEKPEDAKTTQGGDSEKSSD
tara:strand:+ start:1519 stop:2214 length:696 start_codon:yes stop_codon:yes gene_type:complete